MASLGLLTSVVILRGDTQPNTLCYYSALQAHSSVEKAGLISLVKIRFLPTDKQFSLRGETLQTAIEEDRRKGLVPILVGCRLQSNCSVMMHNMNCRLYV